MEPSQNGVKPVMNFDYRTPLDTVQDFLGKLHMKSKMYRPIIRLTKIINSLLNDFQSPSSGIHLVVVRQLTDIGQIVINL